MSRRPSRYSQILPSWRRRRRRRHAQYAQRWGRGGKGEEPKREAARKWGVGVRSRACREWGHGPGASGSSPLPTLSASHSQEFAGRARALEGHYQQGTSACAGVAGAAGATARRSGLGWSTCRRCWSCSLVEVVLEPCAGPTGPLPRPRASFTTSSPRCTLQQRAHNTAGAPLASELHATVLAPPSRASAEGPRSSRMQGKFKDKFLLTRAIPGQSWQSFHCVPPAPVPLHHQILAKAAAATAAAAVAAPAVAAVAESDSQDAAARCCCCRRRRHSCRRSSLESAESVTAKVSVAAASESVATKMRAASSTL